MSYQGLLWRLKLKGKMDLYNNYLMLSTACYIRPVFMYFDSNASVFLFFFWSLMGFLFRFFVLAFQNVLMLRTRSNLMNVICGYG
jgi:hypothetical protein